MTEITAEFFTDPLSRRCWQCEPITRKLRFGFDKHIDWIPRMTASITEEGTDDGPNGTDEERDADDSAREVVEGRGLPVHPSLRGGTPPGTSRLACQFVSSVRENQPRRVERLLRRLREATFVDGTPPDTVADVNTILRECGIGPMPTPDGDALRRDVQRGCDVAVELDTGVSVQGPVETIEVGPEYGAIGGEQAVAIAPPCLRLERDGGVVIIDPRAGYGSLESALRELAPSLQSSQVGHMEQIINSVASRTNREIAEEFGEETITSKVKSFMRAFERAFLTEVAYAVDASIPKTRRILFQLEEASLIEPIYADEMEAWRWNETS